MDDSIFDKGNSIQFVCYGVDSVWYRDNSKMMDLLRKALLEERYEIVSENLHRFDNDKGTGYTGVIVIGESDATFHTYEERGSIEMTVNTCRGPNAGWITVATVVQEIAPKDGVYAHAGIVPIERAARRVAAGSVEVIDCDTHEEFLQTVEDRVHGCYLEMIENGCDGEPDIV